jgi:hypothetical protein
MRVHDDPIADDGKFSRPNDARREQAQLVADAVDYQRVTGVVAALETDHDIGPLG